MRDIQLERAHNLLSEVYNIIEKLTAEPEADPSKVHNNRPKLTKRDVLVIRSMKRNGVKQADIADAFDVSAPTISRICRGLYHR